MRLDVELHGEGAGKERRLLSLVYHVRRRVH
jgi:hypothetical protein